MGRVAGGERGSARGGMPAMAACVVALIDARCFVPTPPALRPPAPSRPQEAKALLGERRALQVSLQASQQEAAALRAELVEARQAAAAARLQADEERRRRETVEQGWATAKEVR